MDIIIKQTRLIFVGLIRFYQLLLSPFFASSCRHIPTCSEYAIEAIRQFGVIKGIYFSTRRIVRCRPYGASGYDPLPSKDDKE